MKIAATGLEHPSELPGKHGAAPKRGAESGAVECNSAFTDAIAAIMRLPLSDEEKAEAVRRIMR
jgi:hypothetical protein